MLALPLLSLSQLLVLPARSDLASSGCGRTRSVHFIRHAEGTHNAAEAEVEASRLHLRDATGVHAALYDAHGTGWVLLEEVSGKTYWDAPLTPAGREQAYALRRSLRTANLQIDAVFSSPFRRTLQTALLSLPQLEQSATTFQLNDSIAQPPPIIVSDLLRERVGPYTCDARLSVNELQSIFNNSMSIDFTH
ncbi:MAG: hypothetical protein SGPRY_013013, partial [Prymnesium sp.]